MDLKTPVGTPGTAAPRPRRRTKPPAERRTDLLDAAEQLFSAKGVGATSVDDICAAAEVAKGTFYLYFDAKEAIQASLQERFTTMLFTRLQEAQERHRPDHVQIRLRTWIATFSQLFFEQVALHDVIFRDFKPQDRRQMNNNPVLSQLSALLARGGELGVWQVAAPRSLAVMLFHALHGALDDAVAQGKGAAHARQVTREALAFFERVLAAPA